MPAQGVPVRLDGGHRLWPPDALAGGHHQGFRLNHGFVHPHGKTVPGRRDGLDSGRQPHSQIRRRGMADKVLRHLLAGVARQPQIIRVHIVTRPLNPPRLRQPFQHHRRQAQLLEPKRTSQSGRPSAQDGNGFIHGRQS